MVATGAGQAHVEVEPGGMVSGCLQPMAMAAPGGPGRRMAISRPRRDRR